MMEGGGSMIIMIGMMVAIFYFFMIRPEKKRKANLQKMRESLSTGDTVTTIGGIIGKVVSIDGDKITFETGEDRVRVQIAKWAVSTVGKPPEEAPR
jgi:preprotein translocase subunit YajC